MKNFVNPFHAPASFCGARVGTIKINAFFRVTTERISHSTSVNGVLLLNNSTALKPTPLGTSKRHRNDQTMENLVNSFAGSALFCGASPGQVKVTLALPFRRCTAGQSSPH